MIGGTAGRHVGNSRVQGATAQPIKREGSGRMHHLRENRSPTTLELRSKLRTLPVRRLKKVGPPPLPSRPRGPCPHIGLARLQDDAAVRPSIGSRCPNELASPWNCTGAPLAPATKEHPVLSVCDNFGFQVGVPGTVRAQVREKEGAWKGRLREGVLGAAPQRGQAGLVSGVERGGGCAGVGRWHRDD